MTDLEPYENINKSISELFLSMSIEPNDSKSGDTLIAFNPMYQDDIEQLVIGSDEYLAYKGNFLNTALEAIGEKIPELKNSLWSEENEAIIEMAAKYSPSALHTGIANLRWLIMELLLLESYQSSVKHIKKSRQNINRFYSIMEDSIPHTTKLRALFTESKTKFNEMFSMDDLSIENHSYEVGCLFDIIYLTLRAHAISNGNIVIKRCQLCKRLFFTNALRRKLCLLDTPNKTCDDKAQSIRSNLNSCTGTLLKRVQRLIDKDNPDNVMVFRRQYNQVVKPLIRVETFGSFEMYEKRMEFLNDFKERYSDVSADLDPIESLDIPIEDLVSRSIEAVGLRG